MSQRLNYEAISPEGLRAILTLNSFVKDIGIEPKLKALVDIRISQINGCVNRYQYSRHQPAVL